MTTRAKMAKTILAAAVIAAVVIPGAAAGSSTGTRITIPPWLANVQEPGSTGWVPKRSTEDQARTVDPLAVGYLIGLGLSPSEVTSWTTGACSHKVKAQSCYAMLQRTVATPKEAGLTVSAAGAQINPGVYGGLRWQWEHHMQSPGTAYKPPIPSYYGSRAPDAPAVGLEQPLPRYYGSTSPYAAQGLRGDQARTVDPLAVSYLIGKGLSPSEVTSWTTGACSHKVKARSCYAILQRMVAPPKIDLVKLFLSRQDRRRHPERGGSNTTTATAAVQGYMSYLSPRPAMTTDTPAVISGPYPVSGGTGVVQTVAWPDSSASPRVVGSYFPTPQDLEVGASYTIGGDQFQDAGRTPWIMSLTPAGLAANAFGTGYALPSAHKGPSVESVLASMSPQTREYTERIMNLTFAQLAAGAAGQP